MGNTPFPKAGDRIRQLREAKGISRRELAAILKVDVSSVAGWEAGKRLPRDRHRRSVAGTLGTDLDSLFASPIGGHDAPITAAIIDTVDALPEVLVDLTRRTRTRLRALRLAAPHATPSFVQTEWRSLVDARIRDGTLQAERIEIFYDLRRLQETVSNIFRYAGRHYHVKSYCAGLTEVVPAMGVYIFDDDEIMLGAYWTGIPPRGRPSIRMSGPPFRRFFHDYWEEAWQRGTPLNVQGPHDLSAVRDLALKLGLHSKQWRDFVEEAKELEVGDGAPPFI